MTSTLDRIDQLETAFEAHGYLVGASAIPGQEEQWLESLRAAFVEVEKVVAFNASRHGYRGLSRAALKALHSSLPTPMWGIEVRA